jgi:DNA mismatch repair ATPase MutS
MGQISSPIIQNLWCRDSAIRSRQDAVTELLQSSELCVTEVAEQLKKLPDLERGITSIYHGRVRPGGVGAW